MQYEEQESTLIKLGLSNSQAKVYLSLAKIGAGASIKTIASISKIDRANLYRTISQLHEIGLVQLTLGKPNTYKALMVQDGIELLLTKRAQEFEETKISSLQAIKNLKNPEPAYHIIEDTFQIVPSGGPEVVFMTAFLKSQKNVCITARVSDMLMWIAENPKNVRDLLGEKGVTFRNILYCDKKVDLKKIQTTSKNRVKLVSEPPEGVFAIIDDREVFIHTKPMLPEWRGTPCFRTNNTVLVGIVKKYFEYLWSEAEEPAV
jgi:sugar-specific transcriptional regulator TrmB